MRHTFFSLIFLCITCLSSCSEANSEEKLAPNPKPPSEENRNVKVIHTFVALCDNKSQGIAPVPARIGNGDDPANNLYWGCSDGAKPIFTKSPYWKKVASKKVESNPAILERLVFEHRKTKAILVVDAWRGSDIKPCLKQFCQSLAGQYFETIDLTKHQIPRKLTLSGGADLLAFIGHNGLMEFSIPKHPANPNREHPVDAIVLCCRSISFFDKHLADSGSSPQLLTATNMYPGAFILHDALEAWFKNEKPDQIRLKAAKAYAKNQKISTKSASTVFAKIP